ncbi:hypothetical protein OAF54_00160 [bacterium]|nr:hypothetical protein [bacterium]
MKLQEILFNSGTGKSCVFKVDDPGYGNITVEVSGGRLYVLDYEASHYPIDRFTKLCDFIYGADGNRLEQLDRFITMTYGGSK